MNLPYYIRVRITCTACQKQLDFVGGAGDSLLSNLIVEEFISDAYKFFTALRWKEVEPDVWGCPKHSGIPKGVSLDA